MCIFFATRKRHRFIHEARAGCRRAGQDLRLPAICSANHAWMLAVDDEFPILDGVGKCNASSEYFICLAKFAGNQQRVPNAL